ncbi:MAG: hypothetical protein ACXADX_16020 [Candidatus Hodarchaeales archaeon]
MLKKDGLVRAREAAQSLMRHLNEMGTIDDMVEEVRARIMIINTEIFAIMQATETFQQESITEVTQKLQNSQDEKKELLQETRTLRNKIIQLETERDLFQHLIRKHEEEKTQLDEQMSYLKIQLELDRAYLQHQTGIAQDSPDTAPSEVEVETTPTSEPNILEILVDKVFDGHLHQQILSHLWTASAPVPVAQLRQENVSESLFNRALMELKARKIVIVDEEGKTVSLTPIEEGKAEE